VNRKLSLACANAVRDYLQSAEGLKGTTMETASFAATKPVDTNATPQCSEEKSDGGDSDGAEVSGRGEASGTIFEPPARCVTEEQAYF
jgi:hypothetical protein